MCISLNAGRGVCGRRSDLRVLQVIPGDGRGSNFIFSRRQVQSLHNFPLALESFFFDTRKSALAFAKACASLRHALQRFRPDIVHVHYGTMAALACALVVDRPLVATFQGSDLNPEPGINWFRAHMGPVLSQLAALRCSRLICVSRQLSKQLWWRKARIIVLPIGVNLDEFKYIGRNEARRQLGWDTSEPVLLFNAGRSPVVKALDLAEKVVARLSQTFRFRFEVMRGDTPPERVPLLMSGADCLLVTSRSEGSPMVVKEALACALPVISVDVGDVRERLEGVWPSSIVSRNPDDIAEAVRGVLETPVRSNGRKAAEAISQQRVAVQLLAVYEGIVETHAHVA